MKLCTKCEGYFEDSRYKCPDCDCVLVSADDKSSAKLTRKIQRKADISVGLRADLYDWCMGGILFIDVLIYLITYFTKWRNFDSSEGLIWASAFAIIILLLCVVFRRVVLKFSPRAIFYKKRHGSEWYPKTFQKIMFKFALTFIAVLSTGFAYFVIVNDTL